VFHRWFPFIFWVFGVYICAALVFESRTGVFLPDKAETAVETRQVFLRTARGCKSGSIVLAFGASKQAM
jgi:uncharacterized membrane protein YedE/YeeE